MHVRRRDAGSFRMFGRVIAERHLRLERRQQHLRRWKHLGRWHTTTGKISIYTYQNGKYLIDINIELFTLINLYIVKAFPLFDRHFWKLNFFIFNMSWLLYWFCLLAGSASSGRTREKHPDDWSQPWPRQKKRSKNRRRLEPSRHRPRCWDKRRGGKIPNSS